MGMDFEIRGVMKRFRFFAIFRGFGKCQRKKIERFFALSVAELDFWV
jgi:hypothetical protein